MHSKDGLYHYTTSCKHSLELLRMGEFIAETCWANWNYVY